MTQATRRITRGGSLTRARHAAFRVSIGGVDITGNRPQRPQRLRSLRYERTFANAANRAQIVIYDETEREVEALIIQGRNDVVLSYGYTTGPFTPRLKLFMVDYTPTFLASGIELNLECLNTIGDAGIGEEKTRTWAGRISDIVQAIAIENGWDYEIDKTLKLEAQDGEETTGLVDQKWQQNNQTDMVFIRQTLLPNAARDSDKVGDYQLFFDDHAEVLHFHPPRLNADVQRVYVWRGRGDTGQVIDFRPTISGKMVAALAGGRGVNHPVTDSNTGEDADTTIDTENTPEKSLLGNFIADPRVRAIGEALVRSASTVLYPASGRTQAEARSRSAWYNAFQHPFSGELEVLGDPFVKGGDMINITVMLRDGSPHYTSGVYLVKKATDTIEGGEFKTTLDVIKNAARQGETRTDGVVLTQRIGEAADLA